MSQKLGAFDAAQGKPNLQAEEYIQQSLDTTKIADVTYVSDVIVPIALMGIQVAVVDASAGISVAAPFDLELLDVIVRCDATVGSGVVTVKKGATAVTNAIVMATDKAVTRAGSIDNAVSSFNKGDLITLETLHASDEGLVTLVVGKPVA